MRFVAAKVTGGMLGDVVDRASHHVCYVAILAVTIAVAVPGLSAQEPADNGRPVVPSQAGLVTVLSGADLRAAGIHTLADALREAAGVDVVATGAFGGGSSTVRGLGGGPEDVVVRWDGILLNIVEAADLASLTLDGVERIEVRGGVSADLAGAGAETMVVDVRTVAPTSRRRAAIEAWSGRDATVLGRGEGAAGGQAWKLSTAASGLRSDGGLVAGESYSRWALGAGLHIGDERASLLRAAFHGAASRYGFLWGDMGMAPPRGSSGLTLDQMQDETVSTISLEAGTTLLERVSVSALVGRHARGFRYRAAYPDTMTWPAPLTYVRHGRAFRTHYEVAAAFPLGNGIVGSIGLEQDDAETTEDDTMSYASAPPPMGPLSILSQWAEARGTAVRLAVSRDVAPWSFAAGIRRDDPKWGRTAVTWRALVARRLGAGARVQVGIRTGFRAPTGSEARSGSPRLRNQTSRTLEAGFQQALARGRVRLSATAIEQRFNDVIAVAPLPAYLGFGSAVINVGAARAHGWELEAEARPLHVLSLRAAWTHLPVSAVSSMVPPSAGDFEVGRPLPDRASDLVVAAATLRLGLGGLLDLCLRSVSRCVRIVGPISADRVARDTLPAYVVLDLGGRLPVARWLQVTVRAENLLDERYAERAGYPARGRSLSAGVHLGSP